jgi:hypothetical protein
MPSRPREGRRYTLWELVGVTLNHHWMDVVNAPSHINDNLIPTLFAV